MIAVLIVCGCGPSSPSGGKHEPATLSSEPALRRNVSYGEGKQRILDVFSTNAPATGRPVIVFFHGGLWRSGDKMDYDFVGRTLAARGVLVVIANYRLYPEVTFPEFLYDGADAVAWVRQNAASYGGNPNHIFVMGHSAGAYIALMLALDPEYLARAGMAPTDLAGVIGISGLYDFLPETGESYAPVFQDTMPVAKTQPIAFASRQTPPILLLTSDHDDVVDPRNTASLAGKLRENGGKVDTITYPETGHIGILLPFSPLFHGSSAIVDDVTSFIGGHQTAKVQKN